MEQLREEYRKFPDLTDQPRAVVHNPQKLAHGPRQVYVALLPVPTRLALMALWADLTVRKPPRHRPRPKQPQLPT